MPMIYATGDCHGDYDKLSYRAFPQQRKMCKDDYMIVCGDFGIWHDCPSERYKLDWLNDRPFTTLFVDGNHENFDRLYSDEFETAEFHGGRVQKIRDSVLHMMRGEIYELHGSTFFAMGGAPSHDISDGILDRASFLSDEEFRQEKYNMVKAGKIFRINHETWWRQEIPFEVEFVYATENLKRHDMRVDYIITHECPWCMSKVLYKVPDENDVNIFLQAVHNSVQYRHWYCGHHHQEEDFENITMLYGNIVRIL